jgi:hypothetical protein
MISVCRFFEIDPAILKQAAVWGLGSLAAAKLTQDEEKNFVEKKKNTKKAIIQGIIGSAAGAAGAMI